MADPNIRRKQMATSEEAKPHPMVKPKIPRVLMGAGGYLTNEERIKQDEEELLAMKKEALGITDEESSEDKPSSEEPEAEPVQAESDTKQEEKPEAKAQEEDDLGAEEKNFKTGAKKDDIAKVFNLLPATSRDMVDQLVM